VFGGKVVIDGTLSKIGCQHGHDQVGQELGPGVAIQPASLQTSA
jgi:hypothetical protein